MKKILAGVDNARVEVAADRDLRHKKSRDTYVPLFVAGLNHKGYYYLGDGIKLFVEELCKLKSNWYYDRSYSGSFYEFLEDYKMKRKEEEERCQTQQKLDKK